MQVVSFVTCSSAPPAASSAASSRSSAAWAWAPGSPSPRTVPSGCSALPALRNTRSPTRTAPATPADGPPGSPIRAGARRLTLILVPSCREIGCGRKRVRANDVQILFDLDPFVGFRHVVRRAAVDVGRNAAMAPMLGVRRAEADGGDRFLAAELAHRVLEDAHHRVLGVA